MRTCKLLITGCLIFAFYSHAKAQEPRTSGADHATAAAEALFVRSDLQAASREAELALRANERDTRALFVAMETAAIEADDAAVLSSATRLCAAAESTTDDEMCEVAAGRISELAANSKTFRRALPAIRQLISSGSSQSGALRLALVAAAADGAPEFDTLLQSRESGLLTDWKIVGPLGRFSNSDFDRIFDPERDGLTRKSYGARHVQNFQFVNGKVDVPEASQRAGVFYAASNLELGTGGEWRVWVESPGTLEVFVDGKRALVKDDRAQSQPQVVWQMRRIDRGLHRVVVKFLPSALPFRVAIMPPAGGVKKRNNKPMIHAGPESEFVSVALRYWRRDYIGFVRQLRTSELARTSANANLMLAQAWSRSTNTEPSEVGAALLAAEKLAPTASAVRLALAEESNNRDRADEALAHLKKVLGENAHSEPALRLLAMMAGRMHWRSESVHAYENLVAEHPSCGNLRDAAWYFSGAGEYARATALEDKMRSCTPGSLLFAQWLAQAGRHADAARAAEAVATRFPLDRPALMMQRQEAALAGDKRMTETASLALADSPEGPPNAAGANQNNPRAAGFFNSMEFYSPYRRNGIQVVRDAEPKKFSGGPAVLLLQDKVSQVTEDGATALYVHLITRVLNRDGIEKYGEVAIPAGAEVLELRTVKPDGTVIEPELNQHKATVSMPALASGDAIEQEYVTWHAGRGGVAAHQEAFEFIFGSLQAPILLSRFVLISPAQLEVAEINGAPKARETRQPDGTRLRIWERNDIPQTNNEGLLPREDLLALVRVAGATDDCTELQAEVREAAIEASRIGPRVAVAAEQVAERDPDALAKSLYTRVVSTISSDTSDFLSGEVTSAEDTLSGNEGSRTSVLLALARSAGLVADLAMAHPIANGALERYSHPLVVFRFAQRTVVVDVESEGMPFGVLGPGIDRSSALLVSLDSRNDQRLAWLKLPPLEGEHLSIAEGDVVFDDAGSFTARVGITMGAQRAAQMREILRGIPAGERKHFFEQLAMRLFPGAADAEGSVQNEAELNLPLKLEVTCTSPHYLDLASAKLEMDQLVPTLGLRKMFATQGSRRLPLLVDSLLFETAIFRVRMPDGVRVVRRVADLDLRSEFGSYRAAFTPLRDGTLEIRREFRIPVQIVRPERYGDFSAFASRIDDTERQRMTLGIDRARSGILSQQ